MVRSMTGFGRGDARSGSGGFTVEMRSVNNRYLDAQVKTPRSLAPLEPRIRKIVQDRFSRGRIDVFVSRSGGEAVPFRLAIDHQLTAQYIALLRELKERYALAGDIDLSDVAALPEVITREEVAEDLDAAWTLLSDCLDRAAAGLLSMREAEGSALAEDISVRLGTISVMAGTVRARVPEMLEQARKRMTDNLSRILREQPEPARMAQEIAILAERTDVSEELTRLESHLRQFRTLLAESGDEPVGRKLDFLVQELGREVNTIASKSLDAEVSLTAVNVKAELEKIREQVQNIE